MSSYATTYQTQSAPESWETVCFTVRRPGCTAWADVVKTLPAARRECATANQVIGPGHRVYAEQEYRGDLPGLIGKTRAVER